MRLVSIHKKKKSSDNLLISKSSRKDLNDINDGPNSPKNSFKLLPQVKSPGKEASKGSNEEG